MWDESDLDRQIDDAARELTAGETPAYFKARVLDRIEPRALPRWKRASLLSTAAATACLVLLVILMRGGGHPSPQSIATNGGPTDSPRHVAQPLTHVAAGPPQAVSTPRRGQARPAERAAQPIDAIDRLALAPLSVERMQLTTIQAPEAIASASLDVAPLVVAPLGADDGSSGRP